jgi:hypothetical protein
MLLDSISISIGPRLHKEMLLLLVPSLACPFYLAMLNRFEIPRDDQVAVLAVIGQLARERCVF